MPLDAIKSLEPLEGSALEERLAKRGFEEGRLIKRPTLGLKETGVMSVAAPTDAEVQAKAEALGIEWSDSFNGRAVQYWGSDERVDSVGDIVRQNWDFEDFAKTSPMPFSHNWSQPPVGRIIDWQVTERSDASYKGPALYLLGLFATKDQWEWADTVYRLVKSGLLRGGSVGFRPLKVLDVKDDKERTTLGLGRYGVVFEESSLLEFSPTSIPANPGAVALQMRSSKQKGMSFFPKDLTMIRELLRQGATEQAKPKDYWMSSEAVLLAVGRELFPDMKFELHKDLDVPVLLDEEGAAGELLAKEDDRIDELYKLVEQVSSTLATHVVESSQVLSDIRSEVERIQSRGYQDTLPESALDVLSQKLIGGR